MRSVDWVAYLLLESFFYICSLCGDGDTAWNRQNIVR